jgi:hypothetical protein
MMNSFTTTINGQEITVYRTQNDFNGNPRYIVHFLSVAPKFDLALAKIKKIGGRRHRGKAFGGGLVFQSYHVDSDLAYALGE